MITHDIDDMENELYGEGDELNKIENLTKSEDAKLKYYLN